MWQLRAALISTRLKSANGGAGVLNSFDKKKLSESDICDLFISPAIRDAGWDPTLQVRREVTLAPGPVVCGMM